MVWVRLNCREVVRGRGVNEEETVDSKKGSAFSGSSGEARSGGAVRFNVDDHKVCPSERLHVTPGEPPSDSFMIDISARHQHRGFSHRTTD